MSVTPRANKLRQVTKPDRAKQILATIRADLQDQLARKNWSYSRLAEETGQDVSGISRTLTGKIESPPFTKVIAMYESLGVPMPVGVSRAATRYSEAELVGIAARALARPGAANDSHVEQARKIIHALAVVGAIGA